MPPNLISFFRFGGRLVFLPPNQGGLITVENYLYIPFFLFLLRILLVNSPSMTVSN